jgi:hypothetical protein
MEASCWGGSSSSNTVVSAVSMMSDELVCEHPNTRSPCTVTQGNACKRLQVKGKLLVGAESGLYWLSCGSVTSYRLDGVLCGVGSPVWGCGRVHCSELSCMESACMVMTVNGDMTKYSGCTWAQDGGPAKLLMAQRVRAYPACYVAICPKKICFA